ncbi:uncharacterized protein LOC131943697 [Physella acuta]|uniref:uncharacterized protein LOC131943697 n=1 Tax=Physella acuta TaxID=109671 RepID=UPI0027DC510E|nr:uncharacterized protein LOC131943697 [Physella acuta]
MVMMKREVILVEGDWRYTNTSPLHFENWRFNFSGSLPVANAAERPDNRNSMKIEIVAPQSKRIDAGKYVCFAVYLVNDNEVNTERYQYLTVTVRNGTLFNFMPLNDYELGPYEAFYPAPSKVKLICSLETQLKDVTFRWMFGSRLSSFNSFQHYSIHKDVSFSGPVKFNVGTDCFYKLHSSTLTVTTEEKYDGYMYVCVATENNKDTLVGNLTIYTVLGYE